MPDNQHPDFSLHLDSRDLSVVYGFGILTGAKPTVIALNHVATGAV